jgi:hypothetical protein
VDSRDCGIPRTWTLSLNLSLNLKKKQKRQITISQKTFNTFLA